MKVSPRPLRICYVLNTFDLGGAETVALDLARSHTRSLFEVEVLGAMDPARDNAPIMLERCRDYGVKAVSLGQANLRSPWALFRFFNYLRNGRFDIVMGHNRGADYWAVRLGRLAGIRHRYWARHLVYPDVGEKHRRRYQGIAGEVHRVIAVSDAVRRFCIEDEGIAGEKVETIVNGIDMDRFKPLTVDQRDMVRRDLGHPDARFMLLFVGRFAEQKAPESFVQLVECLVQAGVPVVGYMCGHGPDEDTLRTLAAVRNGQVRILGLRSDIPELLGACDLFVSTSRYEGLPLNVMEAMATGAPFAGPAIPQINELVEGESDFDAGLFSPPPLHGPVERTLIEAWTETVANLLSTPAKRHQLGALGRAVIGDRFSLQKMVEQYERVFREDCSRGN